MSSRGNWSDGDGGDVDEHDEGDEDGSEKDDDGGDIDEHDEGDEDGSGDDGDGASHDGKFRLGRKNQKRTRIE